MPSLSRAEPAGAAGVFAHPAAAHDHVWMLLEAAVRDRAAGWRTPVLSTVGPDGAPRARTVVLRAVEREAHALLVHSDLRAGKIGEILGDARVTMTFYDPVEGLQLRADGTAGLEVDRAALDQAWARVPTESRGHYGAADAPGDLAGSGARATDGRENFAIMRVTVRRLEWLLLAPGGHVRGESRREPEGWVQRAMAP